MPPGGGSSPCPGRAPAGMFTSGATQESTALLRREAGTASASSGSSIVIVTSANPIGGRFVVPLKMQSAIRSARNDL